MPPSSEWKLSKKETSGTPKGTPNNWNPVWVHECYCTPWLQHMLWSVGMLSPRDDVSLLHPTDPSVWVWSKWIILFSCSQAIHLHYYWPITELMYSIGGLFGIDFILTGLAAAVNVKNAPWTDKHGRDIIDFLINTLHNSVLLADACFPVARMAMLFIGCQRQGGGYTGDCF